MMMRNLLKPTKESLRAICQQFAEADDYEYNLIRYCPALSSDWKKDELIFDAFVYPTYDEAHRKAKLLAAYETKAANDMPAKRYYAIEFQVSAIGVKIYDDKGEWMTWKDYRL